MFKKLIFVLSLLTFSLWFHSASASVVINEIMYDLDGGDIDWIEVYNPDSTDVDLTALKLLVSNSTSNHNISNSSGSLTLHQGDYGVIVGSSVLTSYTGKWGTAGNIFTSSFSLPNDTGKVEINSGDKLSPLSSLVYSSDHGASGNGKSLQKIGSSWQESLPTPSKENVLSSETGNNEHTEGGQNQNNANNADGNTNTSTNTSSAPASNNKIETVKLKTKIIAKTVVFVGLSNLFQSEVTRENEKLFYGRYLWNFGDGDSKEVKINSGDMVKHTYFYPGEYTVYLEYFINNYGDIPDATDKLTIKVLPADIIISAVGDAKDFFIELSNNTSNDVDISKWMLVSGDKRFTFPRNTIIPSKKKITFSPFFTSFTFADRNNLKLVNQDWKTVFDYGLSIAPPVPNIIASKTSVRSVSTLVSKELSLISKETPSPESNSIESIPDENLQANVLKNTTLQSNNNYIYFVFLILISVVGGVAVYFVRKRDPSLQTDEEFEILEE